MCTSMTTGKGELLRGGAGKRDKNEKMDVKCRYIDRQRNLLALYLPIFAHRSKMDIPNMLEEKQ